jgi:hypothetical protein
MPGSQGEYRPGGSKAGARHGALQPQNSLRSSAGATPNQQQKPASKWLQGTKKQQSDTNPRPGILERVHRIALFAVVGMQQGYATVHEARQFGSIRLGQDVLQGSTYGSGTA